MNLRPTRTYIRESNAMKSKSPKDGDHCPACGRYVSTEEGYYAHRDSRDESSEIVSCCSEECADKMQANESIRLALESTPAGHPDRDVIERAAATFERP
jgi:hypothetical protein